MPVQETITAIEASSTVSGQLFTIVSSILIGGAGAALWVRRKLSHDTLEIKKDTAEGDLIQHLEDERDVLKKDKEHLLERLIQTDKEKNDAVNKVGQLTIEVKHLSSQVNQLEQLVTTLSSELRVATKTMQDLAIENAKLDEKMGTMKEIFNMKCDNCTYKKECATRGIAVNKPC